MRVSAVLGFIVALLVGTVALGAVVVGLNSQPPITVNLPPTTTPAAIVTPSPSPTVEPTAITSSPSPSPSAGGSVVPLGTEIGQMAPDFVLPGLSGGEFNTANSRGTPLWVNFMATWCPQCQDELPMMSTMKLDVGDNVDLILVDVAEDQETVLNFMTGLSVDLPTALDQDSKVQQQWGAFALPVHYFLDGNGVVQEVVYGGAPREVFQAALLKIYPDAKFSKP
jgi:cytochrome c biogenesis protein CcmG, thiol:disulfide interchange protein DsbE